MKPEDIPSWAVDRYRYYEVIDNYWSDSVVEDFIEGQASADIVIDKDKIHWSGFCSQGDGASFHGDVIPSLSDYITQHLDPKDYPFTMLMLAADCDHGISLYRTDHRHSHEYSVGASLDIRDDLELIYDPEHPLIEPQWGAWSAQFAAEQESLEADILSDMRSRMQDLYDRLEAENDYLTSDDYIRELLANNPDIWRDELEEAA